MKNLCSPFSRPLILSLLLAMVGPATAHAFPSPVVSCPLTGKDSGPFLTVDQLAPQIVQELQRRFHNPPGDFIDMERRDAEWQETDVVVGSQPMRSTRRFIQGGHEGTRWYVWYESGGIGYSDDIAIFDLPAGANAPRLVIHTFVLRPEQLCGETKAHLHDASDTPERGLNW
jgi:hypothetical protein